MIKASVVIDKSWNLNLFHVHPLLSLHAMQILLLDEATSAVDFETDRLVQELIRREFKDFTVLTIAHRINTIIDSDRVLLLSDGRMMEFDHPAVLLRNPDSMFSKMIAQTGDVAAAHLRRSALAAYKASGRSLD